jgi:SNF2 family DNA or RNA helicase
VIDVLMDKLAKFNPVKIDGRDSYKFRQVAVDYFQTRPEHRVFIGQMTAASEAITLTAACDVGIVEAEYNPAKNAQFISRAHRMGQTLPVFARFLAVPDTLDGRIMRIFRRKAQEMSALFD